MTSRPGIDITPLHRLLLVSHQKAAPPTAAEAKALIEASMQVVTTEAAGVAQNIVAGTAKQGDPNPVVVDDAPTMPQPIRPDCLKRIFLPIDDARLIAVSAETGTICRASASSTGAGSRSTPRGRWPLPCRSIWPSPRR